MLVNKKVVEKNNKWYINVGEDYVLNGLFKMIVWKYSGFIIFEKND